MQGLISFTLVGVSMGIWWASILAAEPGVISLEQYRAIRSGMSLEAAVAIVGRHGEEMSSAGSVTQYLWSNPDGSMLALVVSRGTVHAKTQSGLR